MMVTNFNDEKFFVTMQTDHSRVAGFLAAHWGNAEFAKPQPWNSVVLAAQEHDRGWWQWECRPTLSDAGSPLDYQNNTLHHLGELRTKIYRSAVADIKSIDAYAAVLILDHLTGLLTAGNGAFSFRKDVSDNPIAKAYLENQAEERQSLLSQIRESDQFREHSNDSQIEDNGRLVEVCDALAQFLCNRFPLDNPNRGKDPNRVFSELPVPVRPGLPESRLSVKVVDDHRLAIDAYPFDVDPLPINFIGRWLTTRPHASRQEFLDEFYRAETVAVQYFLQSP
jgi:hypothetical protein